MNEIEINAKTFVPYIDSATITNQIKQVANQINNDYKGQKISFVIVLKGAFMFASDLLKHITVPCEIHFMRYQSYDGLSSTGKASEILGLNSKLTDKRVIIIEDIIDSGLTIDKIHTIIKKDLPKSLKVCTLLYKKEVHKGKINPDYVVFEVENRFIVGYGLDFDEDGRNLDALFQIKL